MEFRASIKEERILSVGAANECSYQVWPLWLHVRKTHICTVVARWSRSAPRRRMEIIAPSLLKHSSCTDVWCGSGEPLKIGLIFIFQLCTLFQSYSALHRCSLPQFTLPLVQAQAHSVDTALSSYNLLPLGEFLMTTKGGEPFAQIGLSRFIPDSRYGQMELQQIITRCDSCSSSTSECEPPPPAQLIPP